MFQRSGGFDDGTPDAVSETEITFQLTPADTAAPRQIEIAAVNSDGTASPAAILTVSDLKPGEDAAETKPPAETGSTGETSPPADTTASGETSPPGETTAPDETATSDETVADDAEETSSPPSGLEEEADG